MPVPSCRLWSLFVSAAVVACGSDAGPARSGDATEATARAATARPPHVLFLVWDTVRADRLGPYRPGPSATPCLDRFAREARVYERAISPGMWTIPSHASMFTGLPVSAHGANARHKWLDQRFTTLAERLRDEAGYATYAFSANPFVSRRNNVLQGFDTIHEAWEEPFAPRVEAATRAKQHPDDHSLPGQDLHKDAAPVAVQDLLEWLDHRDPGAPFLAFLNLMEAHDPRVPTAAAREHVMTPEQVARSYRVDQGQKAQLGAMFGLHEYSAEDAALLGLIYDACLVDLDRATGVLFDELARRGLLDDTLVILTSDHGENLGDHGLYNHKFSVHDTLIHVPLVVRHPALFPAGREPRTVSTRSLHSTVLRAAGLAPGPGDPSPLQDWTHDTAQDEPAFAELVAATPGALENLLPQEQWAPWLRTYQSVERGDHKLIRASDGSRQLFDVRRDPGELTDLLAALEGDAGTDGRNPTDAVDGPPLVLQRLTQLLERWLQSFAPYDPGGAGPDDRERGLSPEMRAKLEGLGYLQGGP